MPHGRSVIVMCMFIALCVSPLSYGSSERIPEHELTRLKEAFEDRRDRMMDRLAGRPAEIVEVREPTRPGRPRYARHYSYSILDFAMQAFWHDEFLDEANDRLLEYADFYRDNTDVRDDRDSFYWSTDVLVRLIEMFGREGSRAPGRLGESAEDALYELMWQYCYDNSRMAQANHLQHNTWNVLESENHHAMLFTTLWDFTRLLSEHPDYRDRKLADESTPAKKYAAIGVDQPYLPSASGEAGTAGEHHAAWSAYIEAFIRERIRKGLFIEVANRNYNLHTLKGFYNVYDFAEDQELRDLAESLLDLHWALWAQEQIDGSRAGGQSRVHGPARLGIGQAGMIGRFYLSDDTDFDPSSLHFTVLHSEYRMPLIVMDIALNWAAHGPYEIRQRRVGRVEEGRWATPDYLLRTDGGVLRYSYVTPEFIMGSLIVPARPYEHWAAISSQNRWSPVLFAGGNPDFPPRVFPFVEGASGTHLNAQRVVQREGTMIAQKLPGNRRGGDMRVFFSHDDLEDRIERDGWIFVRAPRAYAAVRIVQGAYSWDDAEETGQWLRCEEEFTPVIIEAVPGDEYESYEAFQDALIEGAEIDVSDGVMRYHGIHGHVFEFDTGHERPTTVNGEELNKSPDVAYESPFVNSDWDSGVVTIQKGDRQHVIDVN